MPSSPVGEPDDDLKAIIARIADQEIRGILKNSGGSCLRNTNGGGGRQRLNRVPPMAGRVLVLGSDHLHNIGEVIRLVGFVQADVCVDRRVARGMPAVAKADDAEVRCGSTQQRHDRRDRGAALARVDNENASSAPREFSLSGNDLGHARVWYA